MSTLSSSLTPQQQEEYARMGEHMFNSIDFVSGKVLDSEQDIEAVAYIEAGLKSGLHISFLEDREKQILSDAFGRKWYERYGYTADDVLNCAHCRRGYGDLSESEDLYRCSGCHNVWYCSMAHQKADWRHHKKTCAKEPAGPTKLDGPVLPDRTFTLPLGRN